MRGLLPDDWRRNVWALTLTVFISFVGFQFFSPFLPLYIRELGVTDPAKIALWAGAQAAVTPAMSGILSPVFGRLADRFGRKMMLIRSLVGFVVIVAAMGLVTSVEQLFLARVVMGLFSGFTPMVMALATTSAPRDKVPAAIGMVQSAQLLSVAVGPAIGGYVASHFGIRYAFFATAGLCALALLGLIVLFQEVAPGAPGAPRQPTPKVPLRQVFQYPHFSVVMALLFISQFLDRGLALLIPLRVAHMPGVEKIAAISGTIISVGAIAATASANVAARLSREVPTARLLLIGLLVGGPLCAAMALPGGWPVLLVLRMLTGLCLGAAITLTYSLGAAIVPAEHRGAAFGWLGLGLQIGTAASPLASGALAAVSIPGAFLFDGALAWVAAALLLFGARGLRRVDELAGQQEIHGVDVADLLDELDGRAAERVDRPPDLREPEAGVRGRRADVGGQEQLEAAADAVAVDGGDDRFREHVMLQQRVTDDARCLRRRREVPAHVRAGAEGAFAGTGEDDAAARPALEPVPQPRQVRHHLPRHRVESDLVVDGDDHDVRAVRASPYLHVSPPAVPGRRRPCRTPGARSRAGSPRRFSRGEDGVRCTAGACRPRTIGEARRPTCAACRARASGSSAASCPARRGA